MMYNSDIRDLELYMEDVVDSALTVSKIARENTQIIQYIAQRDGVSESEVSFS